MNYLVSKDKVETISRKCSAPEFYVTEESLNSLVEDEALRVELLKSIGKDSTIITYLGDEKDVDGRKIYLKDNKSFLDVWEVKW